MPTIVDAPLLNQIGETELIKAFRHDNDWMRELTAKNNWVGNDVIKVPIRGAAPTVLINNGIYPIASHGRSDKHLVLELNKYETENSDITDDELYALPYDKTNDVQQQHREVLEDKTSEHGLFSIAAPATSAMIPALVTTGVDDGTGRRRLITADLIRLRKQLNDLNVPLTGRVIVLSTEHESDLMVEDNTRVKTWGADFQSGAKGVIHVGFKLYVGNYNPFYTLAAGVYTKGAFGSVSGKQGSVVFWNGNAYKAIGSVKRYMLPADLNPSDRKNVVGFRVYYIAVNTRDEGSAVIISADVV